jgi:hypothetical protein
MIMAVQVLAAGASDQGRASGMPQLEAIHFNEIKALAGFRLANTAKE